MNEFKGIGKTDRDGMFLFKVKIYIGGLTTLIFFGWVKNQHFWDSGQSLVNLFK